MKYLVMAYAAFCAAIITACIVTHSAWPLLAFVFTPEMQSGQNADKKKKG